MINKCIQRLKYHYGDFRYLAVVEFQDRGAIHYHMLADFGYIEQYDLVKIWGKGFVKINEIKNVDNVGAYIIGYMNKKIDDKRLLENKSYLISKNLNKAKELYGYQAIKCMGKNDLWNKEPVYFNSYIAERYGRVVFKEFNLKRYQGLK